MRVYVTSIGEPTTDLCIWSLERLGLEVTLLEARDSLWAKLNLIFSQEKQDFLRVDADVIVNKNILRLIEQTAKWWYQSLTYDWYKQDEAHGGIQFVRQPAIAPVLKHIAEAERLERPESYLSRLPEFYNPRQFITFNQLCGLNGYGQKDIQRIKDTKQRRGQSSNYDFELAEAINALN